MGNVDKIVRFVALKDLIQDQSFGLQISASFPADKRPLSIIFLFLPADVKPCPSEAIFLAPKPLQRLTLYAYLGIF